MNTGDAGSSQDPQTSTQTNKRDEPTLGMKVFSSCTIHKSVQTFFPRAFVSILWRQYWQKCQKSIFQNRQVSRDVTSLLQLLCSERQDWLQSHERRANHIRTEWYETSCSLTSSYSRGWYSSTKQHLCNYVTNPVQQHPILQTYVWWGDWLAHTSWLLQGDVPTIWVGG